MNIYRPITMNKISSMTNREEHILKHFFALKNLDRLNSNF